MKDNFELVKNFQPLWIKLLILSAFLPFPVRGRFLYKRTVVMGATVPSDNRTGMENRAGVSGLKRKCIEIPDDIILTKSYEFVKLNYKNHQ